MVTEIGGQSGIAVRCEFNLDQDAVHLACYYLIAGTDKGVIQYIAKLPILLNKIRETGTFSVFVYRNKT